MMFLQDPEPNAEIIELTKEISKHKINIRYDLILDNDFETKETLLECVNLILQLPKPVTFNTFSLQHFPDYPMTKMAIKAGHVAKEELEDWPTMMRRTTEKLEIYSKIKEKEKNKKQPIAKTLNNIIWMMCWSHVSDPVVRYAVFGRSLGSKIMFHYLNIKSVILWKIWGEGGWLHTASFKHRIISYPYVAISMFLKGDWKELAYKINKRTSKSIIKYVNSRNVGS